MPRLSDSTWRKARLRWERGEATLAELARDYGVSENTVASHKKNEGWTKITETHSEPMPDAPGDTIPASALPQVAEAQRVAELEAEIEALRQDRDSARGIVPLNLPETVDEVRAFVGEARLRRIAMVKINAERKALGWPAKEFAGTDEELDRVMAETAQEYLEARTKYAGESNNRALKMAKRDPDAPGGYRIVGIPVEPTINNYKADPEGAIRRYTKKGFLLIDPPLCQRAPCYRLAATASGNLLYMGFCSAEHMNLDPQTNQQMIHNVTGTAVAYTGSPSRAG